LLTVRRKFGFLDDCCGLTWPGFEAFDKQQPVPLAANAPAGTLTTVDLTWSRKSLNAGVFLSP
jgi:hypothetical protein